MCARVLGASVLCVRVSHARVSCACVRTYVSLGPVYACACKQRDGAMGAKSSTNQAGGGTMAVAGASSPLHPPQTPPMPTPCHPLLHARNPPAPAVTAPPRHLLAPPLPCTAPPTALQCTPSLPPCPTPALTPGAAPWLAAPSPPAPPAPPPPGGGGPGAAGGPRAGLPPPPRPAPLPPGPAARQPAPCDRKCLLCAPQPPHFRLAPPLCPPGGLGDSVVLTPACPPPCRL